MAIPLFILLILYGIFLAAYALFSFFLFFHLIRYGVSGMMKLAVFGWYGAFTFFILALTWFGLRGVDWQAPIFSFITTLP